MNTNHYCLVCGQTISWGVHLFSQRIYGHSLCIKDQCTIEESGATVRAVDLFLALKARSFPVVLEYWDDHKHVDIALPKKLYIEVNGRYHDTRKKIMSDLSRTVYSLEENIPTIVVPNSMLENTASFEHAVNEISKACCLMMKKTVITGINLSFSKVQLQ